jgi:Dam-replacing family
VTTDRQDLGARGEEVVCREIACPVCHRHRGLRRLKANFPSLDLICGNCAAYMAQVKTHRIGTAANPLERPKRIRGAGWIPLQTQFRVGQLRDLYLVGVQQTGRTRTLRWIDLLLGPELYANAEIFVPRVIGKGAKREGHQMFDIELWRLPPACVIRVFEVVGDTG